MCIHSWLHSGTSLGALKKCPCYSAHPSPHLTWILGLHFTVKELVSMMCFLCPVWGRPGGTELGSPEVATVDSADGLMEGRIRPHIPTAPSAGVSAIRSPHWPRRRHPPHWSLFPVPKRQSRSVDETLFSFRCSHLLSLSPHPSGSLPF